MLDVTLVSCNYNTPEILEVMLKSWKEINYAVTNKCLIVDNSTNEDSQLFLNRNNIRNIRNPGGTHHNGVQIALDMVKTRYMLLVDTDVVFKKNALEQLKNYTERNFTLVGEVTGDRGGFQLHRRINPWFFLIDVEFVNYYSIRFTDMNRIRETNSEGFYKNVPLAKNRPFKQYDVGATFLEDVMRFSGMVYNIRLEDEYFKHYEGMSWRKNSGVDNLIKQNSENEIEYEKIYKEYVNIDVEKFFI